MKTTARGWLAFLATVLLSALAACGPGKRSDFKATDITGSDFGHKLELTDHNGVHRTLADFRGKVVVLFFGYTHCPEICPTTLSDMATAVKLLTPDEAKRVQVLFVTVDPERDTPKMLSEYVPYFNPTFLGLYGTPAQTAAAAREFHIFYQKHKEAGPIGYLVDHTAGSYVLDPKGRLRLYQPYAEPPADIAHDLKLLLAE